MHSLNIISLILMWLSLAVGSPETIAAAATHHHSSDNAYLRGAASLHRSLVNHDWTQQIKEFKVMVVNVETSTQVVLETESTGTSYATGFIVDAERGIIATNQHVTGVSPSRVKINFYDGSFTEANTLYYDPTHDFGFYQIDPADVKFDMEAVQFGKWREDLTVGDEVLLIGNNEREEYSVKFGHVEALNVNKGDRHSSYIHTSFDSAGGSSGSPVWNTAGLVIGIHSRGSETTSFDLPVEYFSDALAKIQAKKEISRGEIGVDLELVTIGEAIKHFSLPEAARDEIGQSESGTPKVIQIEGIIPKSSSESILHASDIIYRINGTLIRDDLYLFDAILDQLVGQNVSLEVYSNGAKQILDVPVEDLEQKKVKRFMRFAGATFHDMTPSLRRRYYIAANGAWMSEAEPGSSFSRIGRTSSSGRSKIVIMEINGQKIERLDDLIDACAKIEDGQHTYVVARDFGVYDNSPSPKSLTVNLQFDGLQVFSWNATTLDWEDETGYM